MLELTTRFTALTTSPKAAHGRGLSAPVAVAKTAAHLAYIERAGAVGERAVSGLDDDQRRAVRRAMIENAEAISKTGGANGARVLEKGIVTLPNSWPREAVADACERIAEHLAPAGSEAKALVVEHRDKKRNRHLHYAAQDGLESREAALARRPGAKRVRCGMVLRMSEGGRPKQLRGEIAAIINGIADERGIERVEHRSFAARGIAQQPGRHEGPTSRAIAEKRARAEAERAENEAVAAFLDSGGVGNDIDIFDAPAPPERRTEPQDDPFSTGGAAINEIDLFDEPEPAPAATPPTTPPAAKEPDEEPVRDAGPPPGWIPDDDEEADAEFDRIEARRMRLEAAAERQRQAEEAQKPKTRTPKRRGRRGPPVR